MRGFLGRRFPETVRIGVLGVEDGCGATHLVIALANYLQSVMGKKTAVLELTGQYGLDAMVRRTGSVKNELVGVRYYTRLAVHEIPEVLNSGYEAFVLDFGTDYCAVREEFLRCDRKLVIGSIAPWRVAAYEHFFGKVAEERIKLWEFLILFANRQDKMAMQKRYGVRMTAVPWIENPFCLKKSDISFFQKII